VTDVEFIPVCPATEENPRNSEASVACLGDGRLLLAYSHFHGGAADASPAYIAARISPDGGRTWSRSFELVPNDAAENVMSATLLRLRSGALALFFLRKNSDSDLRAYIRSSDDDGETWHGEALVTPTAGYHVMNNDRVIQLSSGRLLAPVSYSPDWTRDGHFTNVCFYSDDEGKSWQRGAAYLDLPKRGAMEPGLVELKDGRILQIIRTQLGRIYRAFSRDGGSTWSEAEPTLLVSPESPATIKRLPTTGDLVLIWNNNLQAGADHSGRRCPLTCAISRDEGETWEHARNLETDARYDYAYVSATLLEGDLALPTYWVHDRAAGRISLKAARVPTGWFYGR
jgi:sialidase-1